MAFIALGVSGGIGAYKAVEVARLLQKRGHDVQAVMTRAARRFVGPLTFEAITRHPVITSQFAPGLNADIEHIALASSMQLLVVAPATANVIGKFANGIADDFLSALYLATRAPVLIAPAMNTHMWEHPAVKRNVDLLGARGVRFVDPGAGYLACGWIGPGRLAEPAEIASAADALLRHGTTLAGRRVLVTAGPTIEDLDPVRFIGNRSSGRMGFALALEAQARGAEVVLVAGPTTLEPPVVAEIVRVRSAHDMHGAVMARASRVDAVLMAAAVADYTPSAGSASHKIAKGGALTIELERTADILQELGASRGPDQRPVLIGFAAETGDPVPRASKKLQTKQVDLIVANDISESGSGFDVSTNRVTLVSTAGIEPLPLLPKAEVASIVIDRLERLLAAQPAASLDGDRGAPTGTAASR
jgi:phosphopantothenoylcysteine decarboxylase/phosphopantothenate--cysteine ligase